MRCTRSPLKAVTWVVVALVLGVKSCWVTTVALLCSWSLINGAHWGLAGVFGLIDCDNIRVLIL